MALRLFIGSPAAPGGIQSGLALLPVNPIESPLWSAAIPDAPTPISTKLIVGPEQWEAAGLSRFFLRPPGQRTGDELIPAAPRRPMLAKVRFMLGAFHRRHRRGLVEPQVGFHLTLR